MLDAAGLADPYLGKSWELVKDWNESTRYTRKTRRDAEELYGAVVDKKHGVLSWLRSHW